jgi:hypothetical protein
MSDSAMRFYSKLGMASENKIRVPCIIRDEDNLKPHLKRTKTARVNWPLPDNISAVSLSGQSVANVIKLFTAVSYDVSQ